MTDDNELPPIEANDSPLPDQIWAGVRQIAVAGTSFAIGRGYLSSDLAVMLGCIGGVAYPLVLGQLHTRHRAKQLANLGANPLVSGVVLK